MPTVYTPSFANADVYTKYYSNQAGYGDYPSLQTYRGTSYQRGYGIGSIFSSIIRGITPLFQSPFVKQATKSLLNTGLQVGSDILQGQNLKDSMKSRFNQTGADLMDKVVQGMRNQSGSGRRRRKRKMANNSVVAVKKRRKNYPIKKNNKTKKRKIKRRRRNTAKKRKKYYKIKRDILA